jgi:hypothetical protein
MFSFEGNYLYHIHSKVSEKIKLKLLMQRDRALSD